MLVIYAKYKENRMEIDGVSKPLDKHNINAFDNQNLYPYI